MNAIRARFASRDGEQRPPRATAARLERERPAPGDAFTGELRDRIARQWTLAGRPATWRWMAVTATAAGVVVLLAALLVARG